MVFMSMSYNYSSQPINILFNIAIVWQNQINTKHIWIRKPHSTIHYEHIFPTIKTCHIFTNFIQTTQRDNFNWRTPNNLTIIGSSLYSFHFCRISITSCIRPITAIYTILINYFIFFFFVHNYFPF